MSERVDAALEFRIMEAMLTPIFAQFCVLFPTITAGVTKSIYVM